MHGVILREKDGIKKEAIDNNISIAFCKLQIWKEKIYEISIVECKWYPGMRSERIPGFLS